MRPAPADDHLDVGALCFSPDGRLLAIGNAFNSVNVWDAVSWDRVHNITHNGAVRSLHFSPDGRWLAVAGMNKAVEFHDLATGAYDNHATIWEFGASGRTTSR
ncbi:WD40 repeat domain-containing protein [Spirillospora sp. NPDC048911]|uniref:WD40 repeat domain-containing protein n=1 Tax=Spirillospora sp. NPDC048911 TaxID=3364527 RepID=UPI00371567FD